MRLGRAMVWAAGIAVAIWLGVALVERRIRDAEARGVVMPWRHPEP